MKIIKKLLLIVAISGFAILWGWSFLSSWSFFREIAEPMKIKKERKLQLEIKAPKAHVVHKPKHVRGVHLSAWVAGSKKLRSKINKLLEDTELNTVVIAIKEIGGEVYIPGYKGENEYYNFTRAIPDIEEYIKYLNENNFYSIARIVVFKDNNIVKTKPQWAVKDKSTGEIWKDYAGNTWTDPYNKEVWDYNLDIAERAIELGFDEIQFDYIRFPSDGDTKNCQYSQQHSSITASQTLLGFLEESNKRIKRRGANLSIDVFGLTTTSIGDMGIGQKIVEMSKWVDFISPMVYPSHYGKGEYGLENPDAQPYETVYFSMKGATKRLPLEKLRPYLQDFSLKYKYGTEEVRAQIQATYDNGIGDWLLWNPKCSYRKDYLKSKEFASLFEKSTKTVEMANYSLKISTAAKRYVPVKKTVQKFSAGQPEKNN